MEVSVTGQNLFSPRHFEFGNADELMANGPMRAVFGEIKWRF
jgi:hypothetical protein